MSNGTWELVKRLRGVNIMKNWWVLTSKYRIDDTIVREKARLVVKGFTQVYGADYEETYSPVSSYVRLRIFLSIVVVLDLNLVQLDMKNAVLHSKLDRVLYMYQPEYFDDGTGRVNKALYFKVGDNGVTCWVLVFVDDLLTTSSSTAMLKELKELLEAAFELREISPVIKYLGLEIVRDRPTRQHQQNSCADAQEREEEDYRQKFGSLQFAATTTRLDIAFACSKLGSGLTVRSDQHLREVDRRLAYLADTPQRWEADCPWVDNKLAITVTEGLGLQGKLKHMERRYAWLQHMVRRGKFVLKYIQTTEQTADS
ncbi:unnamed protein product [Closterium sp. NIES-53]